MFICSTKSWKTASNISREKWIIIRQTNQRMNSQALQPIFCQLLFFQSPSFLQYAFQVVILMSINSSKMAVSWQPFLFFFFPPWKNVHFLLLNLIQAFRKQDWIFYDRKKLSLAFSNWKFKNQFTIVQIFPLRTCQNLSFSIWMEYITFCGQI